MWVCLCVLVWVGGWVGVRPDACLRVTDTDGSSFLAVRSGPGAYHADVAEPAIEAFEELGCTPRASSACVCVLRVRLARARHVCVHVRLSACLRLRLCVSVCVRVGARPCGLERERMCVSTRWLRAALRTGQVQGAAPRRRAHCAQGRPDTNGRDLWLLGRLWWQ
jgi:hypothetical protein